MKRGEIWIAQLHPVLGHEQGRLRPALIVSADWFNGSRADLITVHPITPAEEAAALACAHRAT